MAKKEKNGKNISVEDLVIGAVYQTYVLDLVKVEKLDEDRKSVTLYNITGAFRQWTDYKNVNIIRRVI